MPPPYISFCNLIAGLVVSVVDPQQGESIIDCCAAPGGKTLYMASLLSGQGNSLSKLLSFYINLLRKNFGILILV